MLQWPSWEQPPLGRQRAFGYGEWLKHPFRSGRDGSPLQPPRVSEEAPGPWPPQAAPQDGCLWGQGAQCSSNYTAAAYLPPPFWKKHPESLKIILGGIAHRAGGSVRSRRVPPEAG